jgi:arginine exporter protein ArgO
MGRMIFYNYMGRYSDVTLFVMGVLGIGLLITAAHFLYQHYQEKKND